MTNEPGPQEALASIREARAAAAEHIRPEWPWDLAMALATGGVFAVFYLPPPWGQLLVVPFALALPWFAVLERRRFGLRLPAEGVSQRSRRLGWVFGLVITGLILVTLLSSLWLDLRWPALAAGAFAVVFTYYVRRAWLGAIREDLSGGPATRSAPGRQGRA